MAVAARRVDVHPYAGRLVVLLPSRSRGELLWHWPRPYSGHEHVGACWFQPFSPAAAYDDTADRIAAVIDADLRRRAEDGGLAQALTRRDEAWLREVLGSIGRPLHKLVYQQVEVLDGLQKKVEDPSLLRGLFGIDHLGMRTLRGLERIAVLAGVRARALPEPLLLTRVLREAGSQVKDFPRVRFPSLGPEVALSGDVAPEIGLLLAELIENATRFSARDTDALVTVASTENPLSAGLRIEIADCGQLPMPSAQLVALNRLLAEPDSVDLHEQIVKGPIGLLVVAILAERHGVRVELHPRLGGGTQAVVELPGALLLEPRLPVPAAPLPALATSDVSEPVVESLRGPWPPLPALPELAMPAKPIEPVGAASTSPPAGSAPGAVTVLPNTGPSTEPAAGGPPPLPRRRGAHRTADRHRAVSDPDLAVSPGSTPTGPDVGAAAAFVQGVHAPIGHCGTDHTREESPPDGGPEPPAGPSAN
ncbi:ATP-binding protein [Actinomadura sp. NPDC023710]|uniref:ATP-binding protein n=1 Tax=Actinomadura sp. NPDC023710 TaxID=3158219 RepID=UPI0033DC5E80